MSTKPETLEFASTEGWHIRHIEDFDSGWTVLGTAEDAMATLHLELQDMGCQVCGVVERKHADASIDPFPHPFESNDTDEEIDNWWRMEPVTVMVRKGADT